MERVVIQDHVQLSNMAQICRYAGFTQTALTRLVLRAMSKLGTSVSRLS